ncbi:hypothetical protein BVY03_06190 [bacterium K02(2017)]|nr:hypothetical protein BVY03_06190 [bacterium K02(2017)]
MRNRYHRGFWAEKVLESNDENGQSCGSSHQDQFIGSLDYFEKEKINLIQAFMDDQLDEGEFYYDQRIFDEYK